MTSDNATVSAYSVNASGDIASALGDIACVLSHIAFASGDIASASSHITFASSHIAFAVGDSQKPWFLGFVAHFVPQSSRKPDGFMQSAKPSGFFRRQVELCSLLSFSGASLNDQDNGDSQRIVLKFSEFTVIITANSKDLC